MKTILVIEDDLAIARGLCDNLKRAGYKVLWEKDGMKGYERAKLEQPDLLILDVMLPSMDGFRICALLKQEDFFPPIFMLTGLTQDQSRLEGLGKGADDYIGKPFNIQELILRIRNALKQREIVGGRSKLLEAEFAKARKIQMASLPRTRPRLQGLDIFGKTLPASEVGGDYFDYVRLGKRRLAVIVADVSGKGLPAAMYVQKIQGIVRSSRKAFSHAPDLLRVVQQHLKGSIESTSFVTAAVVIVDCEKCTLEVAQAGHLPVLLARRRRIRTLKPPGIWIGRTSAGRFEKNLCCETIGLEHGDAILMYSDGLTEARNMRGKEFGLPRLKEWLAAVPNVRSSALIRRCFNEVKKFAGDRPQSDDITIVALNITAPAKNFKRITR